MTVTFCGHSEVYKSETVRIWLRDTVQHLIEAGADMFLVGGYGAFDRMAESVVLELREIYPDIQIVLVLPYLDAKVDAGKYNWTVYPELEQIPKRFAICHRNRWMVDQAEVVIAYVQHSWGGAAQTMEYALKKRKRIIMYIEERTN